MPVASHSSSDSPMLEGRDAPELSVRTFEKPLRQRIPAWFAAGLLLAILLLVAAVAAASSAFLIFSGNPRMERWMLATTIGLFAPFSMLAWRLGRGRFRLAILCGPETVQIGRGLVRVVRSYDEVYLISLDGQRSSVEIAGDGFSASAPLPVLMMLSCVEHLLKRCPYASFADGCGIRSLPRSGARAPQSLLAISRYLRRQAIELFGVALCLGAAMVVWILDLWQKLAALGMIELKVYTTFLTFTAFGVALMVFRSWRALSESRHIGNSVRELQARQVPDLR